jgi:hypothetical protein
MADKATDQNEDAIENEFGRLDFGLQMLKDLEEEESSEKVTEEEPPKEEEATEEPTEGQEQEDTSATDGDDEPAEEEDKTEDREEKPKEEEEGEGPYARSWESIVRAQKKLRQEKSEWKEERQKLESQVSEQTKAMEAIKSKDWDTLERLGLDYREWTSARLNSDDKLSQQSGVPSELVNEIREIREMQQKQIEQQKKESEQRKQEASQASLEKYLGELREVAASSDEFELARGHEEGALELTDMHYQSTGEILDKREALRAVHNQVLEDLKKEFQIERLQKYFPELIEEILNTKRTDKGEENKPKPKPKSKTLTNKNTQSATKASADDIGPMDPDSRLAYGLKLAAELAEVDD